MEHEGRAVVFENVEDLAARIDSADSTSKPDDILVLQEHRPEGRARHARGGLHPDPAQARAAGVKDMVRISDGRMSGTAFGTIVLHA